MALQFSLQTIFSGFERQYSQLNLVHCEKIVQIRSSFWSAFSCNRTEYGNLLSPNTGKSGPEITAYLDTFHAVVVTGSP